MLKQESTNQFNHVLMQQQLQHVHSKETMIKMI